MHWTVLLLSGVTAIDLYKYQRISHDTLYLGEHPHPHNRSRTVHGYAFLHLDWRSELAEHQRRMAHPVSKSLHFKRSVMRAQTVADCAMPIADGAVWKVSRGYFVNSRNTQQLAASFLERAMARAFRRWNCALDQKLVIGPLLGVRSERDGNQINVDVPDGVNEIGFATVTGKPGTIAFTLLFGVFSGPVEQRELTNFKMIFDQAHFRFGNSSERRGVVDFESTATHESGHVYGLDDQYSLNCADATMYATSAQDETKKRTLEPSDLLGVRELYKN